MSDHGLKRYADSHVPCPSCPGGRRGNWDWKHEQIGPASIRGAWAYMTAVILRALHGKQVSSVPHPQWIYPSSPSSPTGRDADQQLHQPLVDIAGRCRLNNEDIFVADRLAHGEGGFLVGVAEGDSTSDLDAESRSNRGLAMGWIGRGAGNRRQQQQASVRILLWPNDGQSDGHTASQSSR